MKIAKNIIIALTLFIALISCQGPQGPMGPQGLSGTEGKNAYELWLEDIKSGQYPQWKEKTSFADYLMFLRGEEGDRGKNGLSSYDMWKSEIQKGNIKDKKGKTWPANRNSQADYWSYLFAFGERGEQGDKGDDSTSKGDKGDQGAKGDKGNKGDKGEDVGKGEDGDQGDQGDQGEDGAKGADGDKGAKGKSVYEMWVEAVEREEIVDPINSPAQWPADKNTIEDFFDYLRAGYVTPTPTPSTFQKSDLVGKWKLYKPNYINKDYTFSLNPDKVSIRDGRIPSNDRPFIYNSEANTLNITEDDDLDPYTYTELTKEINDRGDIIIKAKLNGEEITFIKDNTPDPDSLFQITDLRGSWKLFEGTIYQNKIYTFRIEEGIVAITLRNRNRPTDRTFNYNSETNTLSITEDETFSDLIKINNDTIKVKDMFSSEFLFIRVNS